MNAQDLEPLDNIIETFIHKGAVDPRRKEYVIKELKNFIEALIEKQNLPLNQSEQ